VGTASEDAGDRRVLVALSVAAAAVFATAAALRLGTMPFGDEPHYLIISQALAKYGTVDPSPVYAHGDYRAFYPRDIEPHVLRGANGRPVPLHSFGGPLLWLLPFLLFGRVGAQLVVVAASVLTVVNVFRLLRELGITREYATLVTALFVVGSPLYVYSSMLFIEPFGALVVVFAVRVVLARHNPPGRLVLASAGLGYLPWIHGRLVVFTVVLGGMLAVRLVRERRPWPCVQGLLPLVVLLAGIEAITLVRYGTLNPAAGNVAVGDGLFQLAPHRGLLFLALDARFGLFTNFPLLVLAVPGILLAARRGLLRVNVVLLGTVAPYLLAMSTFPNWAAGYSPPARLLASIAPVLAYYVAVTLQRLHHRLVTGGAVLAGGLALIVSLLSDLRPEERFHTLKSPVDVPVARLAALTDLPFERLVPIAGDGRTLAAGQSRTFLAWGLVVLAAVVATWLAGRRAPAARVPDPASP
jgi:hypothetical protein